MVAPGVDAAAQPAANGDFLDLSGQVFDRPQLATLQRIEDDEQRRHEREQKAHQPDDRHLYPTASP